MRESDVINWLFDETSTFLSNSSLVSVSAPSDHVDEAQTHNGQIYPFIGVRQIASNPDTAGIGNDTLKVDSFSYGTDGVLQSITYRKDVTLRAELVPTVDENPKLRDDLSEDISDHFSLIAEKLNTVKDTTPDDMEDVSVDESTTEGRSDDFVMADGIPVEIEYSRYLVDNDPPVADTVNLDINVGDSVSADAFDETF